MTGQVAVSSVQTKAPLVGKDTRLTWPKNSVPPRSADSRQGQRAPGTNAASIWLKASLAATLDVASTYQGRFGNSAFKLFPWFNQLSHS